MAFLDTLNEAQREAALRVWRASTQEWGRLNKRATSTIQPGTLPAGSGAFDYVDPSIAIIELQRALLENNNLGDAYTIACKSCEIIIQKRNAHYPNKHGRGPNHFQRYEGTCNSEVMKWMHRFRDAVAPGYVSALHKVRKLNQLDELTADQQQEHARLSAIIEAAPDCVK